MVKGAARLIIAACALLLSAPLSAARIEVHVDRDPVPVDESFQLVFEAQDSVDGDPDFSPLEKDFQVLSTAQSSRYSFVNGRASSVKTWTLTLIARSPGRHTIPPISFGKDRSPPLTITVTAAGSGGDPQSDRTEIFIEVEAQPLDPRVQAQAIYRVRLYLGVPVSNASLTDPEVQKGQAVIERLDADRNYETRVMGRRFQVLERSYAVYPQASGPLVLGPVQFQGRVGRDVFSLFDPFGPQPKTVLRQSAPVTMEVKPVPQDFPGRHWLPARRVEIREEWSQDADSFRVGEPMTRTLFIEAEGLSSSQLPELSENYPGVFKVYPDQPVLRDEKSRDGITGTREEKAALIPQQPGTFELPGISIPWWNTQTGKVEYARLPARTVEVMPAAAGAVQQPGAEAPARAPRPGTPAPSPEPAAPEAVSPWMWVSLALALGWAGTILSWFVGRRRSRPRGDETARLSRRQAKEALRAACEAGAPAAARDALMKWGKLAFRDQPPRSLGEIAARCPGPLADELHRLNAALYARPGSKWDGAALWQAFSQHAPSPGADARGQEGDLQPLFRL